MSSKLKDRIKLVARLVFGFAILAALIYRIGFSEIMDVMRAADTGLLFAVLLISAATLFLKFVRWKIILNLSNIKIGFFESSKIYLIGLFFGSVTPSKIGDLFKLYYLRKHYKISRTLSISISILDRVFDVALVFLLSIFGLVMLFQYIPSGFLLGLFLTAFLVILVAMFNEKIFYKVSFVILPRITFLIKRFYKIKVVNKSLVDDLYLPVRVFKENPLFLILTFGLTLLIWVTSASQMQVILLSLGQYATVEMLLVFISIAAAVTLLPITIAGIGTRDATLIFFLSLLAIPSEKALSTSLIYFFFGQLIWAFLGGIYYFTFKKVIK